MALPEIVWVTPREGPGRVGDSLAPGLRRAQSRCPRASEKEQGGGPGDLLCSRNARARNPLVGRAHGEIKQAPPP